MESKERNGAALAASTMVLTVLAAGAMALAVAAGEAYTWPTYPSTLNYNFKTAGFSYPLPTKDVSGTCVNAAKAAGGVYHGKYWAFYHGANKNSLVTEKSITPLLERFDSDFAYITDTLGWPRDSRVKDGYYSAVYLYGSDACTGSNDPNEKGGWQSYIDGYPAVAASYYPVYSFDPSCTYSDKQAQMSAMIHEGIHAILTNLGAAHVHWFQEGGNTWLQQEMEVRRSNKDEYSGMGFLNAGNLMAPFVPIESYSGWLLDGTFGGPGAQGVDAGQGICNWRNTLGGVQYGNLFPTFLGLWVAEGAVPWIWVNVKSNSGKYILETIAEKTDAFTVQHIIMEYRAKLALLDMKKWSSEMKTLLNQNVGGSIKCEFSPCAVDVDAWTVTPYVKTSTNGNVLTPEERTTPGWTGANVIPLTYDGSGTVKLTLQSGWTSGSEKKLSADLTDMALQIAYRSADGTPVYSTPVIGGGQATLNVTGTPAGGVVFAIVTNVSYKYSDAVRQTHYTYKLKMNQGVSGAASYTTKWYEKFTLKYDWDNAKSVTGNNPISSSSNTPTSSSSITPVSSSSVTPTSSSSITLKVTELAYTVELPQANEYASVQVALETSKVTNALGISAAQINSELGGSVKLSGVNPDGKITDDYTANTGYWYDPSGKVTTYSSAEATVFAELDAQNLKFSIGHYPEKASVGDKYIVRAALTAGSSRVLMTFTINVVAGKTTALANAFEKIGYGKRLTVHYEGAGKITTEYVVPTAGRVKISLFTAYGALVANIVNNYMEAGCYNTIIDLNKMHLPAGNYLVRFAYPGMSETRSVILKP